METLTFVLTLGSFVLAAITVYREVTSFSKRMIILICSVFMMGGVYLLTSMDAELDRMGAKLDRIQSIALQADALLENRRFDYTSSSFVFAALAFLEKHQGNYPDSYQRAQELCSKYECMDPKNEHNLTYLASNLQGMIKGMGAISSGSDADE